MGRFDLLQIVSLCGKKGEEGKTAAWGDLSWKDKRPRDCLQLGLHRRPSQASGHTAVTAQGPGSQHTHSWPPLWWSLLHKLLQNTFPNFLGYWNGGVAEFGQWDACLTGEGCASGKPWAFPTKGTNVWIPDSPFLLFECWCGPRRFKNQEINYRILTGDIALNTFNY